jgi:UDP-N-acetylglucosamine 2-epimerase
MMKSEERIKVLMVVAGTRPEIVKGAPIKSIAGRQGFPHLRALRPTL